MISNCLNPACQIPFSHARDGRLFSIDSAMNSCDCKEQAHEIEQYWLCGTCSQFLKVVIEKGKITTAPIETEEPCFCIK